MPIVAEPGFEFESTKTYSYICSCAFRQWRASHSHCRFIHGYALSFHLAFQATELDDRNWVMDFGGLKEVKKFLEATFDHKVLVARDDPDLVTFRQLEESGLIQLTICDHVGCEAFAYMVFRNLSDWVLGTTLLSSVEVREHPGNSATYRRL